MSAFHRPQPPDPSRPKPVSASALARTEKQRRDLIKSLGPCRTGCEDLDQHVLLGGGFERGSVVGISAEEEDAVGVALGLQVLVRALLDNTAQTAHVVTPKPPGTVVILLKNGIAAELRARGVTAAEDLAARRRDCLDRIMLSRVFDMDGLCEVVADLDAAGAAAAAAAVPEMAAEDPPPPVKAVVVDDAKEGAREMAIRQSGAAAAAAATSVENEPQAPSIVAEIQDSQDEDEALSPSSPPQPDTQEAINPDKPSMADTEAKDDIPANTIPAIVLITHFSSLLISFFTQRESSAAYATLRLLASQLRRLSRTLPSHPLILLINSTDAGAVAAASVSSEPQFHESPPPEQQQQQQQQQQPATTAPAVDPTLRSIFNPIHGPRTPNYKANKPTYGLVFTQLLDLHLLCTRAPRPSKDKTATLHAMMTVVEVLLDDVGVWEGERGKRARREQRWTIVLPRNGRIVGVSDGESQKGTG